MTIQQCYEALGGSYDDVSRRLPSESMIKKFAVKFLADTSFEELKENLGSEKTEEAFRSAHTLKGVCANLGFTRLYDSAYEITELLRGGDLAAAKEYYPKVLEDYEVTVNALKAFETEQ